MAEEALRLARLVDAAVWEAARAWQEATQAIAGVALAALRGEPPAVDLSGPAYAIAAAARRAADVLEWLAAREELAREAADLAVNAVSAASSAVLAFLEAVGFALGHGRGISPEAARHLQQARYHAAQAHSRLSGIRGLAEQDPARAAAELRALASEVEQKVLHEVYRAQGILV